MLEKIDLSRKAEKEVYRQAKETYVLGWAWLREG